MASEVSKAHDQATFAIIGFSFKLPLDISQESTLWQVLEHKANLSSKWPKSRLSIDSFEADGVSYALFISQIILCSFSNLNLLPALRPRRSFFQ